MKPFYSILYVPIRPEVKELLTLGLLLRNDKEIIFRYSKNKLNILKDLLPKEPYHLLKLSVQSVEQTVINAEKAYNDTLRSLMTDDKITSSVLAEPYIKYLAAYNKNLLAFTPPQYIDSQLSFGLFQKLFEKLISENEFLEQIVKEQFDIVLKTKELLKPRIEKRVNWDFAVTNRHLKNLILPTVTVDFIGSNGQFVAGETVNFEKSSQHLENDVAKFIALMEAMREENRKSKCFVLGKEPDKKTLPSQHTLWVNINRSNIIDFVDADEYETVAKYIEEKDVMPIA